MRKKLSQLLLAVLLPYLAFAQSGFVHTQNGQFVIDGKPYYYLGTNAWYLSFLASEGQGGNLVRLTHELDNLSELGIKNVRVLVGSDGHPTDRKVQPILQPEPGVYNDTLLVALDRLMEELRKRDMKAVLYLNNAWSWSGGYASYLRWADGAPAEKLDSMDWDAWCAYGAHFAQNRKAQELFLNHVRYIVSRTNTLTGRPYKDDPALMSWQIGNEPRAYSDESKEPFRNWISETAALIKQIDPNHLVSVGSEGKEGCEQDIQFFARLHSDKNIDYLTMHIWPQNWKWVKRAEVATSKQRKLMRSQLEVVNRNTEAYIQEHLTVARQLKKPIVIEEFGYPRDGGGFAPNTTTHAKDAYYSFMLNHVVESKRSGDVLAGANFWGWNGEARTPYTWWQPWEPYMADPAQEEQGLYGVYDSDSTVKVLRRIAKNLR